MEESMQTAPITIDPDIQKLLPPLSPDELAGLEESIINEGVREPLILWAGRGILIDGHNRLGIAQRLGLPYRTREVSFADASEARQWVIRNQLARRNLKPDAASYLRGTLKRETPREAGGRPPKTAENPSAVSATAALANELGVDQRTLRNDERFADAVDALAEATGEEVRDLVLSGKVPKQDTIRLAATAREDPEQAKATVEKIAAGEAKTVKDAARAVSREQTEQKAAELTAAPDWSSNAFRLIHGDVANGLPEIPDESVDFVITDPPYPQEYLHTYSDLSRLAARVLKPGGSLLAMSGEMYLPEVIARLSESMTYHWTVAYLTPGGQAVQVWPRRVNTFWKPVLWYVKGEFSGEWVGDVTRSAVNDNDKRHHDWGQSESGMADLIERFTKPGDTILDPFVGGGTTAVVAVGLARYVVAADIDQQKLDITAGRLAAMAPLNGGEQC